MLGLVTLLAGCGGNQNTVAPASHPERSITHLFWVMLGASCVGFGVIVALLFLGWIRRERPSLPGGGGERAATGVVIGLGVALPIVLLVALFIWSDLFVLSSVAAPTGRTPMTVRVIGHQWWWEVRYPDSGVVTANEIHIPVRTKVTTLVTTADVIHSFWVPELNRKTDMNPGVTNRLLLVADEPGVYRGQCAEFCGLQHAHMSVEVIAEPKAKFNAWLARNAKPAARTNALFGRYCSGCHQVRGTSARADVGPDLTHFGSRRSIAALTRPNTPSNLREWLRDPQHVKPGNRMPNLPLTNGQFAELQRYLESLR
ncbi:MAG: cytochrome c oxidase subunit II [Gaiellaceae bacterium]